MRVFKFGGASVKNASGVRNMSEIVKNYGNGKQLLVVVSAMDKTTNALEEVVELYLQKGDYKQKINELKQFHLAITDELFDANREAKVYKFLDKLFFNLEIDLGLETQPRKLYDQIVGYGEVISTRIVSEYLMTLGVNAQFIDARLYISTDETWKEGKVDWAWSENLIKQELPSILENKIIITQGFIGGTLEGATTTLGREGSDYSAAIFAYCLEAESVTIWKDVPGILNADPRKVQGTTLFSKLSYKDAAEMTYYGATVIHPKTIKPLANRNIPLFVKSFINPENEGTKIGDFESKTDVPAIIFKSKQSFITMAMKDLSSINQSQVSHIFSTFAALNLKINLMQNTAISISICTDTEKDKFEKVVELLQDEFDINILSNLELLTIKNYNEASIQQYSNQSTSLVEQKSATTFQVVKKIA